MQRLCEVLLSLQALRHAATLQNREPMTLWIPAAGDSGRTGVACSGKHQGAVD